MLHPNLNIDTTIEIKAIDFVACLDEENAYPEFLTMAKRSERIVFVTYPGNPLADIHDLKASDVVKEQFIVADSDISYCAFLGKELRKQGVGMRPAMEIGSTGAIINMLRKGYGCSFVPEFAVSEYIKKGDLILLDVSDIDIRICSYFICSKDRWINPVMREFIRFAETVTL